MQVSYPTKITQIRNRLHNDITREKNSIDTEAMNELEVRPKAQTCINLLTIPKKSPIFHAFQQCFQFYMEYGER